MKKNQYLDQNYNTSNNSSFQNLEPYEHSEKDLLLNPEMNYNQNPLHIIGPLYIIGGIIGIFSGIVHSHFDIKNNFPLILRNNKKVKISKYLSEIINHSNHLANSFGSFGIVNLIVSKSMNILLTENKMLKFNKIINIKKIIMNSKKRNLIKNYAQGFLSGCIFKSHQGLKTSLITGVSVGNVFLLYTILKNKINI